MKYLLSKEKDGRLDGQTESYIRFFTMDDLAANISEAIFIKTNHA